MGWLSRAAMASRTQAGEAKSMSATHMGCSFSLPNLSFSLSYLRQPVPHRLRAESNPYSSVVIVFFIYDTKV